GSLVPKKSPWVCLCGLIHALVYRLGIKFGLLRRKNCRPNRVNKSLWLGSPEHREDMTDIKLTLVVACALIDADKRVLIAQRPAGKAMAGLWEFPGGK